LELNSCLSRVIMPFRKLAEVDSQPEFMDIYMHSHLQILMFG
jgi:hypothetical protein